MKDVLKYGSLTVFLAVAGMLTASFLNIVTAPMRAASVTVAAQ